LLKSAFIFICFFHIDKSKNICYNINRTLPVSPESPNLKEGAGRAKEGKMVEIINLTPHPCVVLVEDPQGDLEGATGTGPGAEFRRYRVVATIPPSGRVARAAQWEEIVGSVLVKGRRIPVVRMSYGAPQDLPEPEDGVYYFVSVLTAQAAAAHGRQTDDLLFSGKSVRGRDGRIIGLLSFAQL